MLRVKIRIDRFGRDPLFIRAPDISLYIECIGRPNSLP
jgi:hypothetical protein